MTALSRMVKAGFTVALDGDALLIKPAAKLTLEQRAFIRDHKAALVAELRADDLAQEVRHARVRCCDCRNFVRDRIGDGTGIGSCSVGAGAGRSEPSARYPAGYPADYPLYPLALRHCNQFSSDPAMEPDALALPGWK